MSAAITARPVAGKECQHPERFWQKVDITPSCWHWLGAINSDGYGNYALDGKTPPAHRVSYEMAYGPIAPGLQLDHLCRNRACVNPAHLEAVDVRTNLLRGETVTARRAATTHCPAGHPYDEANTRHDSKGRRSCRACHNARCAARLRNRSPEERERSAAYMRAYNHRRRQARGATA